MQVLSDNPFEELIWDDGTPEIERLVKYAKKMDTDDVVNVIYRGPMFNGNKYCLDISNMNTLKHCWKLSEKEPAYFEYCMAKTNFAEDQIFALTAYLYQRFKEYLPKTGRKHKVDAIENIVNYICHAYIEERVKGK